MYLVSNLRKGLSGAAERAAESLRSETEPTKDVRTSVGPSSDAGSDITISSESETSQVTETVKEEPVPATAGRRWLGMGKFFVAEKVKDPAESVESNEKVEDVETEGIEAEEGIEVEADVQAEDPEGESVEVVAEAEEKTEADEAEETVEVADGGEKQNLVVDTRSNWFQDNFCCFFKTEEGTKAGVVAGVEE
mmetsp:Transcript_4583/g.5520  ORF Transcript_4583/g.5520 Transcript_4583/m.5520 type:complete len:193 (+) Transcript_4583:168-746(+)|eukprot:CAMPEP_0195246032 /NCGR_PEP_ID=MMETSP0706-20130129/174_1 /TAXON_ID=33640 /ORGANISM="Asterionellopsis glacialis, Strain CCMP134" /LENGTH=192 /DNA_ID=CAMNT_0040297357 /DNA_START=151 /DNA_END=729 /DNA_ORIENTATION=-